MGSQANETPETPLSRRQVAAGRTYACAYRLYRAAIQRRRAAIKLLKQHVRPENFRHLFDPRYQAKRAAYSSQVNKWEAQIKRATAVLVRMGHPPYEGAKEDLAAAAFKREIAKNTLTAPHFKEAKAENGAAPVSEPKPPRTSKPTPTHPWRRALLHRKTA